VVRHLRLLGLPEPPPVAHYIVGRMTLGGTIEVSRGAEVYGPRGWATRKRELTALARRFDEADDRFAEAFGALKEGRSSADQAAELFWAAMERDQPAHFSRFADWASAAALIDRLGNLGDTGCDAQGGHGLFYVRTYYID
jgi:hypothetical protein